MEKIVEELTEVNPIKLSEKGKELFYLFMEILDERDEFIELIENEYEKSMNELETGDNVEYNKGIIELCQKVLKGK